MTREVFISVDVESDGPIPGDYSMLSFGAVLVYDLDACFYRELKPMSENFDPDTVAFLKRHGLDREKLTMSGADSALAMREFADWIRKVCGQDGRPVFVAFNATYDWMFVHWYLMHFVGQNPFGISGLDIKAYYMGARGTHYWSETIKRKFDKRFRPDPKELPHTHNALDDAKEQAEIFRRLRGDR